MASPPLPHIDKTAGQSRSPRPWTRDAASRLPGCSAWRVYRFRLRSGEGYGGVLYSRFESQQHPLSRLDERSVQARLGTEEQAHTRVHDAIRRNEARLLRAL